MLSTQYRLRLQKICEKISTGVNVDLNDMIWAEKLSKANTTARDWLKKARLAASNPDIVEGSTDDFLKKISIISGGDCKRCSSRVSIKLGDKYHGKITSAFQTILTGAGVRDQNNAKKYANVLGYIVLIS